MLVVDGGATMNPSTYELLAGVHARRADEVLVLPNSPNVILAAERAAELSDKPARVVPTTAPQEGLAALLAFDPDAGAGRERRGRGTRGRRAARGRRGARGPRRRPGPLRRAATRSATPAASWWPGATPSATLAADARTARRRAPSCSPASPATAPRSTASGSRRTCPTGWRSSTTRAANPPGGGCSARSRPASPSSRGADRRRSCRCRAGPLATRAERARGAGGRCPGAAGKALESARASRPYGDLIEHLPHSHRDRRDVAHGRPTSWWGRTPRWRSWSRSVSSPADARPPPQARRGAGGRRDRPAGGGLVQPALDRPPARRGHAGAPARPAAQARRVLGHRARAARRRGEAPVHTVGLVPVHPATEGLSAATPALARVGRPRALPAHARAAAGEAAGGRAAAGARRRARAARTSPTARTTSTARAAGWPSRSCSCSSSRSRRRRRASRDGRQARPLAARGRASWTAGAGRFPFELTGDQKSGDGARSTRTSHASARCSGC